MKTLMSIPGCAAAEVLKSLHANTISCNYIGLDQSGRIIMEIIYEETQTKLINEIDEYMKKSEEFVAELSHAINKAIEKHNEEFWRPYEELKKKYHEGKKTKLILD